MSKNGDIVGEVLNDTYRLTRKLDQGGMGAVYEAVHARLKRKRFAIKVLRPEAAEAKELFARFRREAEITSELGHPHIVNVIDFHETEDGRQYMVMEFLEGENLGDRLRRAGPLPPRELHRLMEQVASGLQAAHDKGIVHRDMKPENIFLVNTGTDKPLAKVLDFGISKIRHSTSVLTRDHSLLGSPFYMSPEQASGLVKTIDHHTDIFAMGSICYHGVTGKLPFDGPTLQGVIYQVVNHQQDPVTAHNPGLPEVFDRVITRAMAKKKEDRYGSVMEFVDALGKAVHGEEVGDAPLNMKHIGLAETAASVNTGPPAPKKAADAEDLATGETMLGPTGPAPDKPTLDATQDSSALEAGAAKTPKRTRKLRQSEPVVTGPPEPMADDAEPPEEPDAEPVETHGGAEPAADLRLSTYSSATGEHLAVEETAHTLSASSRWPLAAGAVVVLLAGVIAVIALRGPGDANSHETPKAGITAPAGSPAPAPASPAPASRPAVAPAPAPAPETGQPPSSARAALSPDGGAQATSRKHRKSRRKGRKGRKKPKAKPATKTVTPQPAPPPKPAPPPAAVARPKPAPKPKAVPRPRPKKPLGEDLADLPPGGSL